MKILVSLVSIVFFISFGNPKETKYTASTPAAPIVKKFLGIPLTDSIDFIRWKLVLNELNFTLECNYGIGKPNTNGFYNGGKAVFIKGAVQKDKNIVILKNGDQILKLVELNANLLHVVNNDNSLLVGNGGWSYAINNIAPAANDKVNLTSKQPVIKDSMAFEGRTPCGVPGIIEPGKECYKLKWLLVLYGNAQKNVPASYKLLATPYRAEGGRRGNWKIATGKDGKITYQLLDDSGKPFIHLLKLDEGVVIFTDAKGNLLVGNPDFSYTLNRRF